LVDQGADHPSHGEEDDQGQQVGLLGDPEVVEGWGEVPVGEEKRPDRGDRRRHEPADDRHQHHPQQVQQQHAG
jgi:hypothetical protein